MLDTAYRLFNEHGYHATGIDLILAESGVSKATLYKYFSSKEELILEVLKRRHAEFEAMVEDYIRRDRVNGAGDALVIFDAVHDWINSDRFFGCNFINASAEYGAKDDPIHQYAAAHKRALRDKIADLLPASDKSERNQLSDQLCLLMDGAIVTAHVQGKKDAAKQAKQAAKALITAIQE